MYAVAIFIGPDDERSVEGGAARIGQSIELARKASDIFGYPAADRRHDGAGRGVAAVGPIDMGHFVAVLVDAEPVVTPRMATIPELKSDEAGQITSERHRNELEHQVGKRGHVG